MSDLWVALGLVLVLEGLAYAIFPGGMRRALAELLKLPEGQVRAMGLFSAALGVFVVWLVRGS